MKKVICIICAACMCFSMVALPISANIAEMAAYYPGLTETTREEADVVRIRNFNAYTYYKISNPTTTNSTRAVQGWFPSTLSMLINPLEESYSPNGIIGNDDRVLVDTPHSAPYSAIGLITARFENEQEMRYEDNESTGAMIYRDVMLTCAHSVSHETHGWAIRAQVELGRNGASSTALASAWVMDVFVSPKWIDNRDDDYDWAILVLTNDIGSDTGWFGVKFDTGLYGVATTLTGYPSDKFEQSGLWRQFTSTSTLLSITSYDMTYEMDMKAGQSGSPLYHADRTIIGVNTAEIKINGNVTANRGIRITNRLLDIIGGII